MAGDEREHHGSSTLIKKGKNCKKKSRQSEAVYSYDAPHTLSPFKAVYVTHPDVRERAWRELEKVESDEPFIFSQDIKGL